MHKIICTRCKFCCGSQSKAILTSRSHSRSGFALGGLELRRVARRQNQNCTGTSTAFVCHFRLNDKRLANITKLASLNFKRGGRRVNAAGHGGTDTATHRSTDTYTQWDGRVRTVEYTVCDWAELISRWISSQWEHQSTASLRCGHCRRRRCCCCCYRISHWPRRRRRRRLVATLNAERRSSLATTTLTTITRR